MVVHVQVLSVQSVETAPSLLLSTESRRFLFNVGDGTQRLCMEHHVRLAKLQRVFLSELRSHAVGGLPGMVLTVSDTGKPGLHVHGPPGTKQYLNATRHFLHRPDFKLEASEASLGAKQQLQSCYKDEEVVVHSVAVNKPRMGAKRRLDGSPSSIPESDERNHVAVSFVVETLSQRGKFLVQRAMELGVPKGKLFGQLHNGKDVTLADGKVVKSSDCVLPSVPATGCVIVSCPSVAHVDPLVSSEGFKRYQQTEEKAADVQLAVVYHLAGIEVLRHPKYASWARRFGAPVHHVLLGHQACAQKTVYRASAKLQAQMHTVFPNAFPSNEAHELRDAAEPFSRVFPDANDFELIAKESDNIVLGEGMLKYVLFPQARRGFDFSSCWRRLDFNEVRESVKAAMSTLPKQTENASEKRLDADLIDGRITFLGTGCAIPSKYRNVTGMYLELPTIEAEEKSWGGMMLDCGEGSLGQLYRYSGGDLARLRELVDRLRCIWISHNHADHHLGLLRVLSHRKHSGESEPLLVIGPTPLKFWLEEYAQIDPTVHGKYSFAESYYFDEQDDRSTDVETHAEATRVRVWLREALGISQIECVPVKHCMQSYAVVVTFAANGSKLAFSGDCRPSSDFAHKARGAFLMVHEATFEDDLASEAQQKAHATTAEAIGVARQANARHLLLTHFSQRYPKMPSLSNPSEDVVDKEAPLQVLTTIDMLSLRFRELRQPQLMEVCTLLMTQDDEEDSNDQDALASHQAQQEREERKKEKGLTR